jgi:O-antigen ligase/tetratricopeptide (TPR) repeat protein
MSREQLEHALLTGVKVGLWVIPLLVLYMPSALPFPYITGRNFVFRIIVEIAVILWGALICLNRQYRPCSTPLLKAATVFMVVVFFADLLSSNPQRALFSDYEKMEGFVGFFHFYLYFLLLVSTFRTERDWTLFFAVAIGTSAAVSLIAVMQKIGVELPLPDGGIRVHSTIGNASYLASYTLLSTWLIGLLVARYRMGWGYVLALVCILLLNVATIYFTATRSALLGLFVGVGLVLVCVALFAPIAEEKRALVRRSAVGLLVIIAVLPLVIWLLRETAFVQQGDILRRLTDYSFASYTAGDTISTRLMIWQIAWRGIVERPLLGWGQENFYLVFQKYFDSGLYGKEAWFDRAHNIVLDWALHAGLLGLIAYGALWGVTWQSLYRRVRDGHIRLWQGLFVGVFLVSYLVNSQFQFDTFNTYFLFFALVAFIAVAGALVGEVPTRDGSFNGQMRWRVAAISASALMVLSLYFFNAKPLLQARLSMRAMDLSERALSSGDMGIDEMIDAFSQALRYDSMGVSQVREDAGSLVQAVVSSPHWREEEKMRYVSFVLSELRKETFSSAKNIKHLLMVSEVLYVARFLDPAFASEGVKVLRKAAELSPNKQLIHIEIARMYLHWNDYDSALEWLYKAWYLDRSFTGVAADIIAVATVADRADRADEVKRSIALQEWRPRDLRQIGGSYSRVGNFAEALKHYMRLVEVEPHVAEHYFFCAVAHFNLAQVDIARSFFEQAISLDSGLQDEARQYLDRIKAELP